MRASWLYFGVAFIVAPSVRAHSGGASVAVPTSPAGLGMVSDQSFDLRWMDADRRFGTSTVTFDFFYTPSMPPTAVGGVLPFGLEGRPIAVGIDEVDLENRVQFDTSNVPAGSYVIWSVASEEPPDLPVTMVAFSRGVLSIAHDGDQIHPAVLLAIEAEQTSSTGFTIPYECFDPSGSARVTLSVTPRFDGSEATIIARDLPATASGEYEWSAAGFAPGRYGVRAEISDARGLSFSIYSRFHLRVLASTTAVDAGAPDLDLAGDASSPERDGSEDAGSIDSPGAEVLGRDGGVAPAPEEGCSCRATDRSSVKAPPTRVVFAGLVLACLWTRRRRRRSPQLG